MKNIPKISTLFNYFFYGLVAAGIIAGAVWIHHWLEENYFLRKVIERLSAESRVAEVLVTKSELEEASGKILTTIKFLEYDAEGRPLAPKYFTFKGNLIQFQSLVIRFEDRFVQMGDKFRGKSVYLFMKAFVLDGARTQEFEITKTNTIPDGYKVLNAKPEYEQKLWNQFWNYALDPKTREKAGVKNAQIEAPGTMFLPGAFYTLRIEHDGGLLINSQPIPEILKGEKIQ